MNLFVRGLFACVCLFATVMFTGCDTTSQGQPNLQPRPGADVARFRVGETVIVIFSGSPIPVDPHEEPIKEDGTVKVVGGIRLRNRLDLPALTSQWKPELRRLGQLSYASAIDNCLWDALGKAVNLPVYRILGAYRDKVKAYASTQHHATIEEFVTEVKLIQSQGFTAYKIHPPSPNGGHDYKLDIEVAKAVRKAAGDNFTLLNDPVGVYTREEAFKVGRALQELDFICYEDPIPTDDIDGLVQLNQALDIPIHIGEFIFSPYNFAEYIRRGAMDVVRFIVDNVGGITGGMKIARLAESFGMECAPHNWGEAYDHAVHFHCELAMPNNIWFEMTVPQGSSDRPYVKDKFRVAKDGYVYASAKPGLGVELDRAVLYRMTTRIDR